MQLLAALALAVAPLAPGHAMAASIVAAPAKPLDQLVALLLPEEQLLGLAMHTFETTLDRELSAAVIARHPGLKAHVAAAVRPAFTKAMKKEIPGLRREIRAVVVAELSAAEIADALVFFASPTGTKLRTQIYATMAEKPDQSPDQMQAAIMAAVMKNMAAADYPPLLAFGASPAAARMHTVNPKIAAASKAWSDRLLARHGKKLRDIAATATKTYLKGRN
ncbi:MAG: hypothetical protein EOP62_07215 [Sphingomonadales bacterium]|nr:MAG: hypothetical protein EOP62_07215 [Sphingomonadales bacterium]